MSNGETLVKPRPLKTGSRYTNLRCPLPGCPFLTRARHLFNAHLQCNHYCFNCDHYCNSIVEHNCPMPEARRGHADFNSHLDMSNFHELSRSHGGSVLMYRYNKQIESNDIESTFSELEEIVSRFLEQLSQIHGHSKLEITLCILMEKDIQDDEGNTSVKQASIYFKSNHYEMFRPADIPGILVHSAADIIQKKNTFVSNGSGWRVVTVETFELKIGEMRQIDNIAGRGYLPMPISGLKGFINFRNTNDLCFLYCVSCALFNKGRNGKSFRTLEKYFHRFDMTNVNCPVTVNEGIPTFEKNNRIGINLLSHENGRVVISRKCEKTFTRTITLFLIKNLDRYHYVLVTDVNKFLCNKTKNKRYFCQSCFCNFHSQLVLDEHRLTCGTENVSEVFPGPDEKIEFKRWEMTQMFPYVLYWDLESFSTETEATKGNSTKVNCKYTIASYSLCLIYNDGTGPVVKAWEYYDKEDVIEHFFQRVFHHAQNVLSEIRCTNNFVQPTEEELERHERATHCEFCGRKFQSDGTKKIIKTYHHSHILGNYLNSLCQGCNLKIKFKSELVCIAHNSSNYDNHFLLRHIGSSPLFRARDVNVINKGAEQIVQIEILSKEIMIPPIRRSFNTTESKRFCGNRHVRLRFIDSCQFMQDSLANLATALKMEGSENLNLLQESMPIMFPGKTINPNSVELLTKKLAYPYSYLSSPDVLKDGHPIPSKEHFYNDLKREDLTEKEWNTVQKLIQDFEIADFRQFTRIYTMLDTILLAIIFETFRMQCFKTYGLCPLYMSTASGYSWQCFLYFTKSKIEYIRDKQMLDMIKQGVRGGASFATQKINTANNEECPLGYDPNKERTHLVYFDVVSLYATAMLEKFSQSEYEWVNVEDLQKIDWKLYDGQNDVGYILKVDLGYPEAVQDLTVDLPFAPEKCCVKIADLSKEQQRDMQNLNLEKAVTSTPRLLLHCRDRKDYTLHWKCLRYYLENGLTLKKISAGFWFKEVAYFRDYIQFNIDQRKLAMSESQRSLVKLLNNAIFGKTMQANQNKMIVKFCSSAVESRKLLSSPRCADFMPLNENLSMVLLRPKQIKLDKPTMAGMTVLDLAKVIFYQNYYQKLKKVFGDRIRSLYHDTDSTISLIRDPNNTLWSDLVQHREFFDFSKIPPDHLLFKLYPEYPDLRTENKGVSGLLKVESATITQAITNKSKQYSLLYHDQVVERKCKGLPSANLKSFTHQQYEDVIMKKTHHKFDVNMIRSYQHEVYNITVNKIGFHCLDVYRSYPNEKDFNYSLPFGHYKLL